MLIMVVCVFGDLPRPKQAHGWVVPINDQREHCVHHSSWGKERGQKVENVETTPLKLRIQRIMPESSIHIVMASLNNFDTRYEQ